jgi:Fe(3+) dicitrate transport protein
MSLVTSFSLFFFIVPVFSWAQDKPSTKLNKVHSKEAGTQSKSKVSTKKKIKPKLKPKPKDQSKQKAELEAKDADLNTVSIIGSTEKISRVSGSAHRISKKQLEIEEYDDVHRVLKQVPGVYVRDEDGQGLRPNIGLRGANSDRSAKVTLMEDGVLMAPAPYSAPAAYYFPMTTRLTGIEVFKGPSSIKYGPNTIGGAVNLITRAVPRTGVKASVDISHGMYNSSKVHTYYGHGWKNWGFLLEAAHLQTDGFKELDFGGSTGFDKREVMFKMRYNGGNYSSFYNRFDLKLGYADEISNETYLGLSDTDFADNPYRRYAASQKAKMDWMRTQIKLDYHAYIGNSIDLKVTAYRHDFDRNWEKLNRLNSRLTSLPSVLRDPTNLRNSSYIDILRGESEEAIQDSNDYLLIGTNQRTYISQGVQLTGLWRHNAQRWGNVLELGLRIHQDEIIRNHSEQAHEMMEGVLLPRDDEQETIQNKGKAQSLSTYLFNEIRLGTRLRLTPGVRLESFNTTLSNLSDTANQTDPINNEIQGEDWVLLPGMGVWLGLNQNWGMLAGVHRGFSPLNISQTGAVDPELSINYEAGTRWTYKKLKGELIGFLNQYQNLVGTCTQSAGCDVDQLDQQFNAGEAQIYGLEFLTKTRFKINTNLRFEPSITYTWTQAEFQNDFKSGFAQWGEVKTGDLLPYVPQHQASLRLPLQTQSFHFVTIINYTSEMRDIAGQGTLLTEEKIPDQLILDLNAGYRFHKRAQLYMSIDNILNQNTIVSRRPFGARPGKPFLVRVGLKYNL